MSAEDELREFMQTMRKVEDEIRPSYFAYSGLSALLLDVGIECPSDPYTEGEETEILRVLEGMPGMPFETRNCYYNALFLGVAGEGRLVYMEGMATGGILPVAHAWVALPSGKPIDLTWAPHDEDAAEIVASLKAHDRETDPQALLHRARRNLAVSTYVGVPVPSQVVTDKAMERQAAGSIIDDVEGKWPCLRDGVPQEWLDLLTSAQE